MMQQINHHTESINNGKIPNGYKKTELGIFPCDWETDKSFGDLFDFYGGLGITREELGEEGHAYLHYGDLHRGEFNVVSHQQYERLPKCNVHLKDSESYLMQDGDVAFLDASEDLEGTSRSVLIDNPENKPFIAGLHIIYGKPKDQSLDKWFKQYITSTDCVKKQFHHLAVGFKVYGLNRETLPKIRLAFPKSFSEQAEIAEILMTWDKAIELYKKQIEKLKQFKSVCLKKMFPAKGQTVPEWRFKGFTGDWEQRKLGDLLQTISFKAYLKGPEQDGKYEIIQQGNEPIIGYANGLPCDDYQNTVIFGDHTLSLYKPKNPFFVATDGVRIIKGLEDMDGYFLLELLERNKPQSEGYKRYFSILADRDAYFTPDHDEQTQIGACFGRLDDLITIHQRKLEAEQKRRKVLQQYLLNGIVRV